MAYEFFSILPNQEKCNPEEIYSYLESEGRDVFQTYFERNDSKYTFSFKFKSIPEHSWKYDAIFKIKGDKLYLVFYSANGGLRDFLIKIIEECFLSLKIKIIFKEED